MKIPLIAVAPRKGTCKTSADCYRGIPFFLVCQRSWLNYGQVLSGSATGEEIVKSHGLESDHYLQKPVEQEEFIEFVQLVEDFWLAIVQQSPEDD